MLSLTIIGVVAAITLPSLTGNINERTWNTQRKALYARFSQAIALMPSLNGYGNYNGTNTDGIVSVTEDTAAETFLTEGLSKVLKINNICDADHLSDCGIVASYTNMAGSIKNWPKKLSEMNSMFTNTSYKESAGNGVTNSYINPQKDIDTKAAAFETQNGESIAVYYNPNCQGSLAETSWHYTQPKMCANFIYDLNGNKGPNTVGKDIGFITAIYPADSVVVAPVPLTRNLSGGKKQIEAGKACHEMDSESRLPNIEELMAMFYNRDMLGINAGLYWSSTVISPTVAWHLNFGSADSGPHPRANSFNIRCIKR